LCTGNFAQAGTCSIAVRFLYFFLSAATAGLSTANSLVLRFAAD
jgi:hypothetical protein